jgi:hypothetical protein
MAAPKLYLDENLSDRLAFALRKKGYDVIHAREAGRIGRAFPDEAQIEYAASQKRAILTFNWVEFEALAVKWFKEGKEHWGIIVSREHPLKELIRRVADFLKDNQAEDLKNQLRYL